MMPIVIGTAFVLSANTCTDEDEAVSRSGAAQNERDSYESNINDKDADATLGSGSAADGYVSEAGEDDSEERQGIEESRHGYENYDKNQSESSQEGD
jgi:hypothetical protein